LRLNLQRLAHAEFFSGAAGSDWRVAPPTLAVTDHEQGLVGVLAGARSGKLLQRIDAAAVHCKLQTLVSPACPDQIRLLATDPDPLRDVAMRAGVLIQEHAPEALLCSIPCVDDPTILRSHELPFGKEWRVERFSPSALAWESATLPNASAASFGLFRFSRRWERPVFLCSRGSVFRLPSQVGKFIVLKGRRQRILHYEPASKTLSVPAICRPPFLIERALVLCSGMLPRYEPHAPRGGLLHYADIPSQIARLTSALLRQELR
jgi:hypothetical protein